MKKILKKILFIGILIIGIIFIASSIEDSTYADAGRFRGNTSYSRGRSHSRSHSSFGYSSHRYRGSNYIIGGFYHILDYIYLIIIVVFIIGVILAILKRGSKSQDSISDATNYPIDVHTDNLQKIYEIDPNFNPSEVEEKVGRMYIEMQESWQSGNWEPMRAYLTPQLFSRLENQLRSMLSRGERNIVKDIAILNVQLTDFRRHEDNQELDVMLETRTIDYTIDNNNNVISGNENKEVFMGYIYHLVRNIDAQTTEKGKLEAMKCPKCGAPIDINRSAKCEYCGTIIEAKDYDWVISDIEGIYQSDSLN